MQLAHLEAEGSPSDASAADSPPSVGLSRCSSFGLRAAWPCPFCRLSKRKGETVSMEKRRCTAS